MMPIRLAITRTAFESKRMPSMSHWAQVEALAPDPGPFRHQIHGGHAQQRVGQRIKAQHARAGAQAEEAV